ncbi:MAG: FAD:protein FMN transferase [Actinomycetota bacterium]|nr:FAD:protein FMN transferase [Actinomycetota bacterium]
MTAARWSARALGTEVVVAVTSGSDLDAARRAAMAEIDAIDDACSRFRADAELGGLNARAGDTVKVGALLYHAIATSCGVAARTNGAVDPTVGAAVVALGYDRDFAEVVSLKRTDACTGRPEPGWERDRGDQAPAASGRAPGWRCITLCEEDRSVKVPRGVVLDLDATAKALAADRAATAAAAAGVEGVLVSIGGDLATAGAAPPGGWSVGIAVDSSSAASDVQATVSVTSGGLASSSTEIRSWRNGGRRVHHIVDPATGKVAPWRWQLVSVAAASCVDANAASTAAIVWGTRAPGRLERLGLPARLVAADGTVTTVGGWPAETTEGRGRRS